MTTRCGVVVMMRPSNLAALSSHLNADRAPRSNSRRQSRHRRGVSRCRGKEPQPWWEEVELYFLLSPIGAKYGAGAGAEPLAARQILRSIETTRGGDHPASGINNKEGSGYEDGILAGGRGCA